MVIALLVAAVTLIGLGVGPVIVGFSNDRIFEDEGALGLSLLVVNLNAAIAAVMVAVRVARAYPSCVPAPEPGEVHAFVLSAQQLSNRPDNTV